MAAGSAARFVENKLAAMVNGKPLIEHALDAIPRESFSRVLVVTQHENVEAAAKKFGFEALRNEHPERGLPPVPSSRFVGFARNLQLLCYYFSTFRTACTVLHA